MISPNYDPDRTDDSPQAFDGIAIWEVEDLNWLEKAMKDSYCKEVIGPDEYNIVDRSGKYSVVVAMFQGKVVDVVENGKSTLGQKGEAAKKVFAEYESREA